MDEVRYFAMVLAMAQRLPETENARKLRARALDRLDEAVRVEAARRVRCRDVDVDAATHLRPWTMV